MQDEDQLGQSLKKLLAAAKERKAKTSLCKYCGAAFHPKREWQAFCSAGHRVMYHAESKGKASELMEDTIELLRARIAQLEAENAGLRRLNGLNNS
ncbi:MAG: hypothetical protein ABFD89_29585 [Bryobacteraceae bacterium]